MLDSLSYQSNLVNLWQKLSLSKGWELLENGSLLCLRSPYLYPWFNMCWGIQTLQDLEQAKTFYKDYPFCINNTLHSSFSFDVSSYFEEAREDIEMHLDLSHIPVVPLDHPNAEIKEVLSLQDFKKFVELLADMFSIPSEDLYPYMHTRWQHSCFFLAYIKDECVGTSTFYLDDMGFACLEAIGVVESYRRKGIGRALTEACLQKAKSLNTKVAGLRGTIEGSKLYEQLGFKTIQHWEYRITPS